MRMWKLFALVAPFAATLTMASAPVLAEHDDGPCRQDVNALCPSVTPGPGSFRYCLGTLCPDLAPGPGGFVSCLQKYSDKLSAECQQHLSDVQAKVAAWKQAFDQACSADVQSFCSGVEPGHHAIFKCLRDHKDELSQTCTDQLAKFHHGHHQCMKSEG